MRRKRIKIFNIRTFNISSRIGRIFQQVFRFMSVVQKNIIKSDFYLEEHFVLITFYKASSWYLNGLGFNLVIFEFRTKSRRLKLTYGDCVRQQKYISQVMFCKYSSKLNYLYLLYTIEIYNSLYKRIHKVFDEFNTHTNNRKHSEICLKSNEVAT